MLRTVLQFVGIVGAAFVAILSIAILFDMQHMPKVVYVRPSNVQSAVDAVHASPESAGAKIAAESHTTTASLQTESQIAAAAASKETTVGNEVYRIQNPYDFPPKSEAELYAAARAAIVNIYCQSGSQLGSISGSGVIIDSRGVILTNAHVAQYILLTTDSRLNMECFIRTGSPSQNRYTADILYFPAAWMAKHAKDIAEKRPRGTGEHDYALLVITRTTDGSPLPTSFPHLPVDTRETIAFTSDRVLLAGYPAEFAIRGNAGAKLYPTAIFTSIGDLMTFDERSVDLIALGGAVLAQSGSSGGAVINLWGQLVGIISTTSEGNTTAERELRAITLAYISRDLQRETGTNLTSVLLGNLQAQAGNFMRTQAPMLSAKLIAHLP